MTRYRVSGMLCSCVIDTTDDAVGAILSRKVSKR